ncbi:MAG: DUF309 domain-containing protein [Acidobacteria bacterium]|nr:DUF309 domain-containing protein [Acidobacteriota bacterium]
MAFVRFESTPRQGETFELCENKVMFGRHLSCQCVLNHPTVSREHFFIEQTGDKFFVVDNESGNGTLVNHEAVSWVELQDGDEIQAGPFVCKFFLTDHHEAAKETDMEELNAQLENLNEPGFDAEQEFAYPIEYLDGITHFNAGRYFEAHEVWEEIWLHSADDSKLFYQMLIQAAVGLHHFMRGNLRGARGMYKNVIAKLEKLPAVFQSLDLEEFARQYKTFFADLLEDRDNEQFGIDKPRPLIHLMENGETLDATGNLPTDEL